MTTLNVLNGYGRATPAPRDPLQDRCRRCGQRLSRGTGNVGFLARDHGAVQRGFAGRGVRRVVVEIAVELEALVRRERKLRSRTAAVDDAVGEDHARAVADHRAFRVAVRADVEVRRDTRHVTNRGHGQRRLARAAGEARRCDVVALDAAVAVGRRMDDQRVVDRADVAVGEVDRVVAHVQRDEVRDVHGAAEELDAIVVGAVDLEVLDDRAGADGIERDAVQLVAGATSKPGCLTTT